jgi:elongation factor P
MPSPFSNGKSGLPDPRRPAVKASDLRPGMAVIFDGKLYVITYFMHVTPGNLRAKVQLKIKDVKLGLTVEKRLRSDEEVEQTDLDRREIEYVYKDNTGFVFMDRETYDQFALPEELVGDLMKYLKPNTVVTGLAHDGNIITIDLPKAVDLIVADTSPQVKGATATNQMKDAEMETGLKVRVPPFIAIGETIRISTETGDYMSRA